MRTMKNNKTGVKVDIIAHIILKNFWEYYIIDGEDQETPMAWVMGDYDEMGSVSIEEAKPYILSYTKDLEEVLPAKGWSWT